MRDWTKAHAECLARSINSAGASRFEIPVIVKDETYVVTVQHKAVTEEQSGAVLKLAGARQIVKAMAATKQESTELVIHLEGGAVYVVKAHIRGEGWKTGL